MLSARATRAGALLAALLCVAAQDGAQDPDELWARGERDAALALLAEQLARQPQDAGLRAALAARQMEAQRFEAALVSVAPLGKEADGLRGTALYLLGRYDEALRCLSPSDPTQTLMRVEALEALGREADAEAAVAEAAGALGEQHPRILALRGRRLLAAGRAAEALPLFRAAVAQDPLDREALFGLGQALVRTGAREEGLAVLQRHRELLPLLDARDFALQSLALEPMHAGSHARLGDVERQLGRLDAAEAEYRLAAQLAGPGEVVSVALRHARLLSDDRADLPGALALLDAALERGDDAHLLVRAGDLLAGAGRHDEARARYERALLLRPGDEQIRARLAALPAAVPPQ